MSRKELIDACVKGRAKLVIYDIKHRSSQQEEIEGLLRDHQPFSEMTLDQLRAQYHDIMEGVEGLEDDEPSKET